VIAATALLSTATACSAAYWWHRQEIARQKQTWQSHRQEERTGRIRAEVRLRTLVKDQQQQQQQQQQSNNPVKKKPSGGGDSSKNNKKSTVSMNMQSIGVVISPYTKRMGTPRQGALVPSSRGRIKFTCPAAALDGMDGYSHLWVIFEFHANTNVNNQRSKIRPPRADTKVGTLATRSPHRPNALGLSLVVVEKWDAATNELHISGLDLVNGTPVYDVKPCVMWDIPGYRGPNENEGTAVPSVLRMPDWVQQDDALARVEFREAALDDLQAMVEAGRLAPLYTTGSDGLVAARRTLQEVLAQDPRSSHKGLKGNARGSQSADDTTYKLILGQVQVEFVVLEDKVEVVTVTAVDFDPDVYVDGVPLISGTK
jgi:tRNA-Thr(GGU) m(6)t(6)A37 methyltransferase TsaA